MPLTSVTGGPTCDRALAIVAAACCCSRARSTLLSRKAAPFGGRAPAAPPPPPDGMVGWILAKQAEFYQRLFAPHPRRQDRRQRGVELLGVSFLYGIFHAAGPGHGKAVISSYVVANEETWRRGVVLSFASALLQALVAVAFVGIAAALLNATARPMCDADRVDRAGELRVDRADRPAADLGQGQGLPARGAQPEPAAARGRRGGDAAARPQARTITSMITIMITIIAITIMRTITIMRSRPWPRSSPSRPSSRPRARLGLGPCTRTGAAGAGRAGRLAARTFGDRRGRSAAVLGRDPGAGVRAGAGPVLGRRRRDLRDGARHRDHRRRHRDARGRRARLAQQLRRLAVGLRHAGDARHRGRRRVRGAGLWLAAADRLHGDRARRPPC